MWFINIDTGDYKKETRPKRIKAKVVDGKLEEFFGWDDRKVDVKEISSAVSASIQLPAYLTSKQVEGKDTAAAYSFEARKSALSLINQIKEKAKLQGDVDIKLDEWVDKETGDTKTALKYVVYSKKKEGS